jgi:hypothetical protein
MCVRMNVCTKSSSVAQTIIRRLLTIEAHVQSHGCCGQNDTETGVLRILIFPSPILIPLTLHFSQLSGAVRFAILRPKCQGTRGGSPHSNNDKKNRCKDISFIFYARLTLATLFWKWNWLFLNNCRIPNSNEIRLPCEAGIVNIYIRCVRVVNSFRKPPMQFLFVSMTKLQKFNKIHYIHFWRLPEGSEDYHINHRTDGVPAKIRTKHFPNTSLPSQKQVCNSKVQLSEMWDVNY